MSDRSPWWERLAALKAEHGPQARDAVRAATRRIDERCWALPGDSPVCPYLPVDWRGGAFRVKRVTCRVKRCPRATEES